MTTSQHRVRLLTSEGQFVGYADTPPFLVMPKVVVWGSRTFVTRERRHPDGRVDLDYFEAFAWVAPVSEESSR